MVAPPRNHPPTATSLEAFALLSVEFANLPQVVSQHPGQEDYVARAWLELLQVRVSEAGARLERVHQHRVFITFGNEPTLADSVEAALQLASTLVQSPLLIFQTPLTVRMGLALEQTTARNPLSSVTERSLATDGVLVLSRDLAQRIGFKRYAFEPVQAPAGQSGPLATDSFLQLALDPAKALTHSPAQTADPLLTELNQPVPVVEPPAIAFSPSPPPVEPIAVTQVVSHPPLASVTEAPASPTVYPQPMPQPTEAVISTPAEPATPTVVNTVLPPTSPPTFLPQPQPTASAAPLPRPVYAPAPATGAASSRSVLATLFDGRLPAIPTFTPEGLLSSEGQPVAVAPVPFQQAIPALTGWLQGFLQTQAHKTTRGQLLVIEAPSGMGKTTLLQMARMHLDPATQAPAVEGAAPPEPPFLWMQGHSLHHRPEAPFPLEVWRHGLRSFFNLPLEGVPQTYAQQHIEGVLNQIVANPPVSGETWAFWRDWFDLPGGDPQAGLSPQACLTHWRQLLVDLARLKPLVLVLDNLDQADAASQNLLLQLLNTNILAEAPIALVITAQANLPRSQAFQELYTAMAGDTLALAPLDEAAMMAFLDAGPLAGQAHALPNALVKQLHHGSQGLPLLLEEYLRYLNLQGLLIPDPATGQLKAASADTIAQAQLPGTLPALLQQRALTLTENARQVLQVASVLGAKFSPSTLMGVLQLEESAFQETLQSLWEQGWVVPDVANDLTFRHGSLREFFYYGTPENVRQQLHQLIHQSLVSGYSEPTLLSPLLVAHHAVHGGLLPEWATASQQAGFQLARLGTVEATNEILLPLLTTTANLAEVDRPALIQWLVSLNQAPYPSLATGLMERYVADQGETVAVEPLRQLANLYEWTGAFRKAQNTLTFAVETRQAGLAPLPQLQLLLHQSDLLLQQGRIGQAAQILANTVEPVLRAQAGSFSLDEQSELQLQRFLQQSQITLAQQGQLPDETALHQAREWIAQTQDPHAERSLLMVQAKGQLIKGQQTAVHRTLDQLLPLIEQSSDQAYYLGQWGLLAAEAHLQIGDVGNALLILPNTLLQAEQARDFNTALQAQVLEGVAYAQQNHWQQAGERWSAVLARSTEWDLTTPALKSWRWLSRLQLAVDQPGQAMETARHGLEEALRPPVAHLLEAYELAMVLVDAYLALGDVPSAGQLLRQHWDGLTATRSAPLIAQGTQAIAMMHLTLAAQQDGVRRSYSLEQAQRYYQRALQVWHSIGNHDQRARLEKAYRQRLMPLSLG